MYRTDFWTLWEKVRVGCFKRTASKHVYYLRWNRSPAQGGCMRQMLGPGVLGRPRGIGWKGRWEGGSGWGIHVNPWLILVNLWQKLLQYCKVISLQLIKKIISKKIKKSCSWKYITIWRPVLPPILAHPQVQSASFLLLPCTSFREWWRSATAAAHNVILVEVDGKCPWEMPICNWHCL